MLDLRTLDPARQTADRRVALALGYGALACLTFAAVGAGAGGWALATAVVLALGGLPWIFAFGGRWRLLDDALDGVPFWLRGDRVGAWATAPIGGAALALWLAALLGMPDALAVLATLAGAGAYVAFVAWVEARYERLILLDLTVLETRFERITDLRESRLVAASQYLPTA
ncbi:hypothetical protein DVA67_000335 [Solirubrobacter sp. CPCC 204708]|uniref:Uncharacterized protein n=1 Tax=Solirubrobacter deserti TaxID=2282478 RepID=A0ABT4RML9_9ACTN|nr:hypothetical protein [Solirubrobacter deserti]MBE2314404.1 hypothetical protein [Solirubrobacter deserti]MDA0139551.1 hypothetical protein [Solirubrobacter deserti]